MNRHIRMLTDLALTALAGFIAFLLPVLIHPPASFPKAPLFPAVRAALERPQVGSFIALAVVGVLAGLLLRTRWYLIGPAAMALFPVCTFAEMVADPTSHNLFPIEFVCYGIYAIPAVIGAGVAQGLFRRPAPHPA